MESLTTAQARRLLIQHGPNVLPKEPRVTVLELFLRQYLNPFFLILGGAALLALLAKSTLDASLILGILFGMGLVSFWQEYKAERTIATLKDLLKPQATVLRDGGKGVIPASELVPGDLIFLEAGDRIPADCLILEAHDLEVDESVLTGESLPVAKTAGHVRNDTDCLFTGTVVTHGSAHAVVTATGAKTKLGKIAVTITTITDEPTPLEHKITKLAKVMVGAVVVLVTGITLLDLWIGKTLGDVLLTNLSLAVAAVPEGLPAVITIALAVGAQRMSQQKALVRKMSAIEALGNVDVICTDKTGTLTSGRMSVIGFVRITDATTKDRLNSALAHDEIATRVLVLCNKALVAQVADGQSTLVGDPTEVALLDVVQAQGISLDAVRKQHAVLREFSFDQRHRRMCVITKKDDTSELHCKGAPETLLDLCTKVADGRIRALTNHDREHIHEQIATLTGFGYRVLGLAYRLVQDVSRSRIELEQGLVWVGLAVLADPIRPEAKETVAKVQSFGIRVVMVTGDHEKTAATIAREIGLIDTQGQVVTGEQLSAMNNEQYTECLSSVRVFARITPEQKLTLVRTFQTKGLITIVTGDGVNDAPALKQADVGIAMGKSGTDVARQAADLVISDDNFATVVRAIEEGSRITRNTARATNYLVACNIGEIATIAGAALFGLPTPLTAGQILWMNLVTDGLPAVALAQDPYHDEHRRINRSTASLLNHQFLILAGLGMAASTLFLYALAVMVGGAQYGRTITFTVLVGFQLVVAFLVRGTRASIFSNTLLFLAVALTIVFQGALLVIPSLRSLFALTPLW